MRLERKLSSLPTAKSLKVRAGTALRLGRPGPFSRKRSFPGSPAPLGTQDPGKSRSVSASKAGAPYGLLRVQASVSGSIRTRFLVLRLKAKRGENNVPSRRSLVPWTLLASSLPSFRLSTSLRGLNKRSRVPPPLRRPHILPPL